jgi:lipase
VRLHVHTWGDDDAPPIVCLHGVQAHGRRFRRLAEERLAGTNRVLAFDLRGHGHSSWDPPWSIEAHVEDIGETAHFLGVERATWIGHSFGGRLVLELLGRAPDLVERAVLIDPAVAVDPEIAAMRAEEQRGDVSFATWEEARAARSESVPRAPEDFLEEELRDHLEASPDGRFRLRYLPGAVIAAFGEMTSWPPDPAKPASTLVVVGDESWIVRESDLDWLRSRFGPNLEVARVPGGHICLWEAYEETADAVERFLARAT